MCGVGMRNMGLFHVLLQPLISSCDYDKFPVVTFIKESLTREVRNEGQ